MELFLMSLTIKMVPNLYISPSKFIIKMETNQMKKENSMDSKINNKPLMLLYPELCPSAQLANTETMKFPNQPSKLMTQMIWFLKK